MEINRLINPFHVSTDGCYGTQPQVVHHAKKDASHRVLCKSSDSWQAFLSNVPRDAKSAVGTIYAGVAELAQS